MRDDALDVVHEKQDEVYIQTYRGQERTEEIILKNQRT